VTYSPDLAVPGAAARVGALAEQAVKSGVRRLVLLSGRGEEGALLGEKAVREAGAEWTILRSTWFNQNFSEGSEAVEEIAKATGRALRYVPITIEQYKSLLAQHEVPAELVSLIAYLL